MKAIFTIVVLAVSLISVSAFSAEKTRSPSAKKRKHRANRVISSHEGCESGHWIKTVSSNGRIVTLEDGSIWKVDIADAINSVLWLPTTDITSCDDKLINAEDGESVDATEIH